MDVDEPHKQLKARLERGHRRVDSATPGSPEWDAAQAEVDDVKRRVQALRPLSSVVGNHILGRIGPMVLEDDCLVQGTIAALGHAGEELRVEVSRIPDRVHSRGEFLAALEDLATAADFILEFEVNELDLTFYAWDREGKAAGASPPE